MRAVQEKLELVAKIQNLKDYINNKPNISNDELDLLKKQYTLMSEYDKILGRRLYSHYSDISNALFYNPHLKTAHAENPSTPKKESVKPARAEYELTQEQFNHLVNIISSIF